MCGVAAEPVKQCVFGAGVTWWPRCGFPSGDLQCSAVWGGAVGVMRRGSGTAPAAAAAAPAALYLVLQHRYSWQVGRVATCRPLVLNHVVYTCPLRPHLPMQTLVARHWAAAPEASPPATTEPCSARLRSPYFRPAPSPAAARRWAAAQWMCLPWTTECFGCR